MSDPTAKKQKTTNDEAPPLYKDVDPTQLVICAKPIGNDIKNATVTHEGKRLTFQLTKADSSVRCPFGVNDGSKYNGKPSLSIELPREQLTFFRDVIEAAVKRAAVVNKALWFGTIKPLPSDDEVRNGFISRIKTDDADKFPSTLKLNICLTDGPKKVVVKSATRDAHGNLSKPKIASSDALVRGCRVVPVLRTAGGAWMTVKKRSFEYGLVFETCQLLVVDETAGYEGDSMNFEGVDVATSSETELNDEADAADA